MSELLAGVRVIESAVLLNGDRLGSLLGNLGAEVIKVESPGRGDYLRDILGQLVPHYSPMHVEANKHKRSVTLDLRTDEGRELFWRLLATADVFVDGNGADVCNALGIGYDHQRARKPDIIYCHYTGFGTTGPYARVPTHGMQMNSLTGAQPYEMGADGFMHLSAPAGLGNMAKGGDGSAAGAIHGAFYVAAALHHRSRTGEGVHIDIAAPDAIIMQAYAQAIFALNEHRITDRSSLPPIQGNEYTGAKLQFYETADHQVVILGAVEPKFWKAFCHAVDREDLLGVGAPDDMIDFTANEDELRRDLQALFHTRDQREWVELGASAGFPIGPAYRSVLEARSDPHLSARQIFHEGVHPVAGPFTYVGEPAIVSGQPYEVRRPAPSLGEHTREILGELGVTKEEIDGLAERGVV